MSDLTGVAIFIKTFLRDKHLYDTVAHIRSTMPEVQMIIADDGETNSPKDVFYRQLEYAGHVIIRMPFDAGFGAKSNAMCRKLRTEWCDPQYVLIGSDDFDFKPATVRAGIEKLKHVLDNEPTYSIASGRVNNNPYEGHLHVDTLAGTVEETFIDLSRPPQLAAGVPFYRCEITVNYSLIRSDALGFTACQLHWDEDVKIGGGEHGAFFYDALVRYHRVCYVPGVNITEQTGKPTDVRYLSYRGRAKEPGRPCFASRGIKEYTMFGGGVEHP